MKRFVWVLLVSVCIAGTAMAVKRVRWENAMVQAVEPSRPVVVDGVERPQSEFAVIEATAPDFSAWIHAIDGKRIAGFNEIAPQTLFLAPGEHTFGLMFENYRGLSVARAHGEVVATVQAGRVYMPRATAVPAAESGRRMALRFELLDYGTDFPRPCLTSLIAKHRQMGAASFEMRIAAYRECIAAQRYEDRHLEAPRAP